MSDVDMVQVPAVELLGKPLNWAAWIADGGAATNDPHIIQHPVLDHVNIKLMQPSVQDSWYRIFMQKYKIGVNPLLDDGGEITGWQAVYAVSGKSYTAETPQLAVCRLLVSDMIGDQVMVPALLMP